MASESLLPIHFYTAMTTTRIPRLNTQKNAERSIRLCCGPEAGYWIRLSVALGTLCQNGMQALPTVKRPGDCVLS